MLKKNRLTIQPQLKRVQKTLDQDKLTRVSLLLGIFKALNILYSRRLADSWVNLANSNPPEISG